MVEEAGEDTDGMADSVSQLQAKLKALTHGKVDIMADANTYKNTTQILREMSAAWEDMTDKERAAALELMGGKRQANILASLIQNFDTVEEVIQTSTNSQGSALKENEKYLDSIQGRLDQFSNSLQTFWNNMLNSNVIKGFVEFGTNVIKFLDTIPGKLIAISAIIAGLIKFKGFNVFGAGKTVIAQLQTYQQAFYKLASFKSMNLDIGSTGNFNTQAVNAYAAAVQGLTAKTQAQMLAAAGLNAEQAREVLTVNNITEAEQNEALAKANLTNSTCKLQTARVADVITTDMAADKDQEAAISAFLAENANKKLSIALLERAVKTGALSAEQAAQIASDYALTGANMTLASSFKAVGSAIALAFKTNPVGMILTIITTILTATSIIDGFTQSAEEAAQAAKDALSTYNSTQTELQNQKSTVDELIASYQRLSSGVDTTNNQNIGLTTTSYQEYLDTVNSIADMFPELIAGYDSEGNALLTLKGKIDSVTEAYENKQKAAAAQFLTPENKENIWKSYNDTVNGEDPLRPSGTLLEKQGFLEVLQKMTDEELIEFAKKLSAAGATGSNKKKDKELAEYLQSFGVDYIGDGWTVKEIFNDFGLSGINIVEEVETADGEVIKSTNKFRDNLATALSNIDSTIDSEISNIKQAVSAGLIWNSDYQKLDKDTKAFVDTIVSNLNPDIIAQSGATGIDDFVSKLMTSVKNADSELITGINDVQSDVTKAISSGDDQGFKEAQKKFEDLIPDDWYVDGEIKINDNDDMITKYLKGLAQDIEEQSKNYEVQLQFKEDYNASQGKVEKYQDLVEARKKFASSLPAEERYFGNVDQYDRQIIPVTDELLNLLKTKKLVDDSFTKESLGSYMTTFGMQDFITSGQLAGQQILYTPILPNGEILDRSTLNKYISEITKDASSEADVLDADKKGVQIGDTFVHGIVNGVTNVDDELMNSILDPIFNNLDKENITKYGDNVNSIVTDAIVDAFGITDSEAVKEVQDAVSGILSEAVKGAGADVDIKELIDSTFMDIATTAQAIQRSYAQHVKQAEIYDKEYEAKEREKVKASTLFGDDSDLKDAAEYIKVARAMSNVSDMLAKSYQAVANAWAGDDKILETDELIDAYNQWVNAGYTVPEGSNWTEDQIAALQILKALMGEYKTDINTIAQSFADVGVAVKTVNFDLSETLKNNSGAIDSIQENISSYQDALEKLESGSFTMSDFVDLIQKFPDLAKGVKVTSHGFDGLSGNLRKAIRSSPKELINSLKDTRSQLQALGKDTSEIDGLITALDQLPSSGVDDLSDQFVTLSDGMDAAKEAYGKLQEAMSKNPNQGYETRAEAIDKMKELMEEGKIGSESELWDIAKAYGFTYNSAKTINENADALYNFISAREAWYKTDEDGNLTYEGTENFIKDAEAAFNSSDKLKELGAKWNYDNGELNFDFGNADWDTVVSELSKTKALAGLTSGEFADLITQVGQYFEIWEDADDVSTYIKAISESSKDNTTKVADMTDAVESYYKKVTGESIDLSSLDEAGIDALELDDSMERLLKTYLELAEKCKDPLEITKNLEDANKRMKELGATDYTFNFESKDLDDLTTQIDNAKTMLKNLKNEDGTLKVGVSKEDYQAAQNMLAALIRQKQSLDTAAVLKVNTADADSEIGTVIQKLQQFKSDYNELEIQTAIGADTTEAQQNLNSAIASLQEENPKVLADLGIDLSKSNSEINAAINSITPEVMVKCGLDASLIEGYQEEEHEAKGKVTWDNDTSAVDSWAQQSHTADGTVKWGNDTTHVKTSFTATGTINWSGTPKADGTAHANGTAFSSGSWGAPKTETALTGELGPELLVRGNKWITVGENGAEFTQVKRGDIIFNHEQTKQLFENGYVTSRGKAYAEGTAYLSGGGRHKTYTFTTSSASKKKSSSSGSNSRSSSTSNNMSNAADSANEFEETFDWLEIKLEKVNEQLDLMNAKLENAVGYSAKNTIIDQMLSTNKSKLSTLEKGVKLYKDYSNQLLKEIPSRYREMAKNGSIAITEFAGEADEKTVEAIKNYREWAQKVADLTQQTEELKTEMSDLAKQKFDNISDQYDNTIALIENQTEKLSDQVSLMEDRGYVAAKQYYEAMMSSTKQHSSELVKEKKALQGVLDQQVKLGNIKKYDERWYEMVKEIYEVDSAIVECTSDLEEYQNAINDIYWDNFDGLTSRLDYLSDETQSLIDLMEDSDKLISTPKDKEFWGEKDVKWTEEGIVSLGLYAQQMEIAEYKSKQYKKAINDLNKDYKDGKYSETEYLDKLNELKSAQYDAIGSYYDAQEAIKDLNETRVDSIKKGIEKEIDAYEELIDKKKEELDAEKDLYDFQKSTMEQQKDISDIQRKLAALSGDNSASAIAKRKQLEADLAEAKSALEESYYDRSIDQRQEALDKELEDFQDEKNAEIEKWEKYLDQIELVVADSLSIVQDNASLVYDTLNKKADEYNLTLSDAILTPWKDGALAVSDYQTVFDTAMSSTTNQLEAMKNKWQEVIDKMSEAAGKEIQKQKEDNKKTTSATYQKKTKKPKKPATSTPKKKNTTSKAKAKKITTGSKINAKGAKIYGYAGGQGYTQYFSSDPIYVVLGEQNGYYKVRYHKASSGFTGFFKKSDVKAYAKGSKGIDKDQWALLDELGPELQLVPDSNGRLAYIQRGTSIIPSDISENLMKLGQLDPQDVLDRNRPQIGVPHITNNEISINMDIAEVVHIDKVTNDTLPDLAQVVEKQMDSYMVKINNSLKKFTR